MEWYACANLIHHLLNDVHRLVVCPISIGVSAKAQPGDTGHDNSSAEDTTNPIVIHDTRQRHIVVHMLLARPPSSERNVFWRYRLTDDADNAVFPFRWKCAIPLLQIRVDHLRELKYLLSFRFEISFVGCGSKQVRSSAQVGQINAYKCQTICSILFVEITLAYPAFRAGEIVNRFRSLNTACDL